MESKLGHIDPSLEKQLKGHRSAITALSYSPNDLQIASSSLDNSVLVGIQPFSSIESYLMIICLLP